MFVFVCLCVCVFADLFCFLDDPQIYDGAHVALQIVGRRFQEERMLAIADVTSAALKAS